MFRVSIVSLLILAAAPLISGGTDAFQAGRIEFVGRGGTECVVVVSSADRSFLLVRGAVLAVKKKTGDIWLRITDRDGKYLRCSVEKSTGNLSVAEGDGAMYLYALNREGTYSDAKTVLSELIFLYEEFIRNTDATEDPVLIAREVKKFSGGIDALIPEMKRMNDKYPELVRLYVSPPVELREEAKTLQVLDSRLRDAFYKVRMFEKDPDVAKALDELYLVLSKMKDTRK